MILFEAIYRRSFNTPISCSVLINRVLIGLDMLAEMEQRILVIKKNLKVAQDRHKSYLDHHKVFKNFYVREHVYFHIKPRNIFFRIGACAKMTP